MTSAADLDDVLAHLAHVLPGDQLLLREMREQLTSDQIRVVVLGEAKRGKSSLINALIGRPVLPIGVTPVTSVVTEVREGKSESVRVRYLDGRVRYVEPQLIAEFVSEEHNPGNVRGVQVVEVAIPNTRWTDSVVFIDTPGTGSIQEQHDAAATAAAKTMDVAVAVLTSDSPVSARERAQISAAARQSAEILVVVTKADLLTTAELDQVVTYTRAAVSDVAGRDVEIIAASTKNACAEDDPGLVKVRNVITALATDPRRHTLIRSLTARARRLAKAQQDELELELSFATLAGDEAASRAESFAAALARVRGDARTAVDVVRAGVRALNADLDRSITSERSVLASRLRVLVDEATALHGLVPTTERQLMERMTEAATEHAESWRQSLAVDVERELDRLGKRATTLIDDTVAQLRETAEQTLGIRLNLTLDPVALSPDSSFFYVRDSGSDAAAQIASMVRRRLPGPLRRRSIASRLAEASASLADRQLGRARGDLRSRLSDAERALAGQVDAGLGDIVHRLERAVRAATELATSARAQRDDRVRIVVDRRDNLTRAMRRLDELVGNRS